MPEVVEPPFRQARPLEKPLERPRDVGAEERSTSAAREDKVALVPFRAKGNALFPLPSCVFMQLLGYIGWHCQCPMAPSSLQLDQSVLPIDPLELEADVNQAGFEVHVLPAKAKCFSLTQTERERD